MKSWSLDIGYSNSVPTSIRLPTDIFIIYLFNRKLLDGYVFLVYYWTAGTFWTNLRFGYFWPGEYPTACATLVTVSTKPVILASDRSLNRINICCKR